MTATFYFRLNLFIIFLTKSSFGEGTAPLGDPSFHLISEHHNGLVRGWSRGADFIKVLGLLKWVFPSILVSNLKLLEFLKGNYSCCFK